MPVQRTSDCAGHMAGTSSFGLSGVNCHSIVGQPGSRSEPEHLALPWLRMRCWARPRSNLLLAAVAAASSAKALFACSLAAAHLAFLHDHMCVPGLPAVPLCWEA